MFGQLMEVIDNDYLRYILHVEAVQRGRRADLDQAVYAAAEDPVAETGALATALLAAEQGTNVAAQIRRSCRTGATAPVSTVVPGGNGDGAVGGGGRWKGQDRAAQLRPDPDALVPIVKRPAREDRPQRAVLVRERQEVQTCHGAA